MTTLETDTTLEYTENEGRPMFRCRIQVYRDPDRPTVLLVGRHERPYLVSPEQEKARNRAMRKHGSFGLNCWSADLEPLVKAACERFGLDRDCVLLIDARKSAVWDLKGNRIGTQDQIDRRHNGHCGSFWFPMDRATVDQLLGRPVDWEDFLGPDPA